MVQFDNQNRQIKVKIVYYGPALGGKTTCLQHIHGVTDPERRATLYSLNTSSDRTLFFDLLSLDLGQIRGYQLALQLYTVPGQVQYDATRRAVLSGADGVVFVADSQEQCRQANIDSLENLWTNLAANGLDRRVMPLVFHFNKRDLEHVLGLDDLNRDLNPKGLTAIATVATEGAGVMQGFAAITETTLRAVADKLGLGTSPRAVERLLEHVRGALEPYVPQGEDELAHRKRAATVSQRATAADQALGADELVAEAVQANVAMTELNALLERTRSELQHKLHLLAGIHEYSALIAAAHDPEEILRGLLDSSLRLLGVPSGTVIAVPGTGPMHEVAVHGIAHDPLLLTSDETGEPLATALAAEQKARLLVRDEDDSSSDVDERVLEALEHAGFASAIVVPLVAQERILGLLLLYGSRNRRPLDGDDMQLAMVLGSAAAVGCANARAWSELEALNRDLEAQVVARTGELQRSLHELRALTTELERGKQRIDDAYGELAELDRVKAELIQRLARELRQPLSSVVSAARVLDSYSAELPAKGARVVSVISAEARRLEGTVQSVVEASLLAQGQRALEPEPVELEGLFKRALMPVRDAAANRGIRFRVMIPNSLRVLVCDRISMEAALRAVVKNAVEFNRDGGEVRIAVRRCEWEGVPGVTITVADTGLGLETDQTDEVFEAFWQGGNLPAGSSRGVGLGLTVARMAVAGHGGRIEFESSPGSGSQITISLPLSQ